jgi:calreticulin
MGKLKMMRHTLLLLNSLSFVSGRIYFSETFGDGWESRWTFSKWKESAKDDPAKMGKWVTATGKWFRDAAEDRGIQTAEIMKFYSLAASFDSFSNEGKELVVQYQAKYEKDLSCGGGDLKVGPTQKDLTMFGDPTPYNIMFGPDQCNTNKRTHLIFSYNGKNFLKKAELPFKQIGEGISHLYRLVLKPDSTVRVEVDQELVYEGSLKDDWEMLPSRELSDPDDKKPVDWIEEAMIVDPTDKKPADWVDEKRSRDPTASKPEEWDEEEDGEWEAPYSDNPAYKGEWTARRISNPAFKGVWEAKKIANPEFVDDPALYKYTDIGYVGFDVYQVKGGTIFDNIILTDTIAEADELAQKWKALSEVEHAGKKKSEDASDAAFAKARAARAARDAITKGTEKKDADKVASEKTAPSAKGSEEL